MKEKFHEIFKFECIIALETYTNESIKVTIDNKQKLIALLKDRHELKLTTNTVFATLLQDYVREYDTFCGSTIGNIARKYIDLVEEIQLDVDIKYDITFIDNLEENVINLIIDIIENNLD